MAYQLQLIMPALIALEERKPRLVEHRQQRGGRGGKGIPTLQQVTSALGRRPPAHRQKPGRPGSVPPTEPLEHARPKSPELQERPAKMADILGKELMRRFGDSVILVTGAASGIGHATMRRLYDEGARIGAADLDLARLDELVEFEREMAPVGCLLDRVAVK